MEKYKRQTEIYNPEDFNLPVTIIGVGNIGSQTALALARLGIEDLTVYDDDDVEIHNLASQSFFLSDLGRSKVDSVLKQVKEINEEAYVLANKEKYMGGAVEDEIVIVAVDSMDERKKICDAMEKGGSKPRLIIDGRVGGPQLEIYTCLNYEEWRNTFTDTADTDPCGARYICYISMVIGALIANQVKRFLKEEPYKKEIIFNIDNLALLKT